MPPQTSSQPHPTTPATDTDVAEDDTKAVASAIADTHPLLIWDKHHCWDDVRKETKEITSVFMKHNRWYAPLFSQAPDEAINFWWEELRIKEIQLLSGRCNQHPQGLGDQGGQAPSEVDAQHPRQRSGANPRKAGYFCGHTTRKRIAELHKAEMKRLEDECAARIAAGKPAGPPTDEDEV
ncbi:hypothetical protein PIB30_029821 [Stylosanthes scabra]|uniref:Uncharacterized protein n=1 Tax=Stylosanthes scabra TaxID=79078 RepID=A0ABU6V9Q0_9FABA|nr:hypothetical protein [Stylosanthes scabra]